MRTFENKNGLKYTNTVKHYYVYGYIGDTPVIEGGGYYFTEAKEDAKEFAASGKYNRVEFYKAVSYYYYDNEVDSEKTYYKI